MENALVYDFYTMISDACLDNWSSWIYNCIQNIDDSTVKMVLEQCFAALFSKWTMSDVFFNFNIRSFLSKIPNINSEYKSLLPEKPNQFINMSQYHNYHYH